MTENRVALDVIGVKSPCPVSWDAMSGDERSRFCAHCGLHVHNLSAMTTDEAQRLVCERAGRLCVRFERDVRGRVVTLDYETPPRHGRSWRFWGAIAASLGLAGAAVRALLWQSPAPPAPPDVLMGDVVVGAIVLPTTGPSGASPSLDSTEPRS